MSKEGTVLTAAQEHVVKLAANGFTDKEIGERLGCSAQTVKFHLGDVYRELNFTREGTNARVLLARWWWTWQVHVRDNEVMDSLLERSEIIEQLLVDTEKRLSLIETLLTAALRNDRHSTVKVERALAEVHALVIGAEAVSEAA